jgi:hypothetical protein
MDLKERGWDGVTGFMWFTIGTCGHGNEPVDSINYREFLDALKNCQFLKKGSAPLELFF